MTKEEIKAIIAQKIEGQGTNLDAASVLPTILNWLVDNSEGGLPKECLFDVGEIETGVIMDIDETTAYMLQSKVLLIKNSNNDYYTRTSDYLIDKSYVSQYLDELATSEGKTALFVDAFWGAVSWDVKRPNSYDEADMIILVHFPTEEERKFGIVWLIA